MKARPILVVRSPYPVSSERYDRIKQAANEYICFILFRPQLDDYIFETYNVINSETINFDKLKELLIEK